MTEQTRRHPVHSPDIEIRIMQTGSALRESLGRVLQAVPGSPQGPQALAQRINIDKVLASRVLRAVGSPDEMAAMHRFPGPEPLRRVLREAAHLGVDSSMIAEAERAVDRFEGLIRDDLGDRGALDAIVSAWVPEARRDFEVKWKQSAFKAMSQLKGVRTEAIVATAIIHPSADRERLDLIWISGFVGLQRLRPGATVKLATRRLGHGENGRHPRTLDGRPIEGFHDSVLEAFSTTPLPRVDVHKAGQVMHYTLDAAGFGPSDRRDLVLGEANFDELPRQHDTGDGRQAFVFAEVSVPAMSLQFDAIVHEDVFPGADAKLRLYDTAFEGVASVNDRSRDLDQLDLLETADPLGSTVARIGSAVVPRYGAMIGHVFDALGWDRDAFRAYRTRIGYPVYGSQVAMCFDLPRRE